MTHNNNDEPLQKINKLSSNTLADLKASLNVVYPNLFDSEGNLEVGELQKLANNFNVADEKESYCFTWAGKTASKRHAYTPSGANLTSNPSRSKNFDTTKNIIIEGDNLEVLKLLQKSYTKKVKCIYIDPPYNTGNDFVYNDHFATSQHQYWQEAGYKSADGVQLKKLSRDNGRYHSDWLSMINSRLLLARTLLRDDGVIFVSIDDNEVHNLRKVMDEVFGIENFIGQMVWHARGRSKTLVSTDHEYILIYAKKIESLVPLYDTKGNVPNWYGEDIVRTYANPDNDSRGVWRDAQHTVTKKKAHYTQSVNRLNGQVIENEIINDNVWYGHETWMYAPNTLRDLYADNRLFFTETNEKLALKVKKFKFEDEPVAALVGLVERKNISSRHGTEELGKLFNEEVFDYPKPSSLICKLVKSCTRDDDIILDFFAGSGTTAQAVMELNAADDGNRQYILVQMPEATSEGSEARKAGYATISQICIERVKRAGKQITNAGVDTGFKVFELSPSNFPENNFVSDPDKTAEQNIEALKGHIQKAKQTDLLASGTATAQLLSEIALKDGFLLIRSHSLQKDFSANKVYCISDGVKSMLVCVDPTVDSITIQQLNDYKDTKFVCLEQALDTTKKWNLKNILGANLWAV